MNLERELLHFVLTDIKALNTAILRGIEASFVADSLLRKLLNVVFQYYKKYGRVLTEGVLLKILEKASDIKEEEKKNILMLFDEILELQPSCPFDFILDEVIEAEKNKRINEMLLNAVNVSEKRNSEDSINTLKSALSSIETLGSATILGGDIKDSIDERKRRYLDVKKNPEEAQGILTPFAMFNDLTNGVMPGEFCLVMSSTSEGKSTFLLNIGYYAYAQLGKNVIYIQIEMNKEATEGRLDALDSNLRARDIWNARLTGDEEEQYFKTLEKQRKRRGIFYICDIPSDCTTDVISAKIEDLKLQFSPDLVIVDYFDIMTPSYSEKIGVSGWEARKTMAVNLKSIARKHNIPLWTAAQVDAEGMKSKEKSYEVYNVALTKYLPAQTDITISLKSLNTDITSASGIAKLVASLKKNRNNAKGNWVIVAEFSKFRMEQDTRTILHKQL